MRIGNPGVATPKGGGSWLGMLTRIQRMETCQGFLPLPVGYGAVLGFQSEDLGLSITFSSSVEILLSIDSKSMTSWGKRAGPAVPSGNLVAVPPKSSPTEAVESFHFIYLMISHGSHFVCCAGFPLLMYSCLHSLSSAACLVAFLGSLVWLPHK